MTRTTRSLPVRQDTLGTELSEIARQAGYELLTHIPKPSGLLPVPPWQLLAYQAQHPQVSLAELADAPFGVLLFDGRFTTTTINVFRAPGPFPAGHEPSIEAVIELYDLLARTGVMLWDPIEHVVIHCRTNTERTRVLRQWWSSRGPGDR